jgi:nitrogen regulatory protein PII
MKMIKSIIRPNKVDDVKEALAKLSIAGMTVTEVRGHGKQKGHTAIYRGKEYNVSLLPKMEIEVVVPDALADDAIKAILTAARTGEIGDGRVFVLPVLESHRIRTGEKAATRATGLFERPRYWSLGRASTSVTPPACAAATSAASAMSSGLRLAAKVTATGVTGSVDTGLPASLQARQPPSRIETASWPRTLKVQ